MSIRYNNMKSNIIFITQYYYIIYYILYIARVLSASATILATSHIRTHTRHTRVGRHIVLLSYIIIHTWYITVVILFVSRNGVCAHRVFSIIVIITLFICQILFISLRAALISSSSQSSWNRSENQLYTRDVYNTTITTVIIIRTYSYYVPVESHNK